MRPRALAAIGVALAAVLAISACSSAPDVRGEDARRRIEREGAEATLARARALHRGGDSDEAVALLETLLATPAGAKAEPEILYALGRIEFERARYDAATVHLNRGLERHPNASAALETKWLLARAQTGAGRPDLSIPLLKSLQRESLSDAETGRLHKDLADAYAALDKPMTALWWYHRAAPMLATDAEREDLDARVRRIVLEGLSPEQLPEVAYLYRDDLAGRTAAERLAALREAEPTPFYQITGSAAGSYELPEGPIDGRIGVVLPLTGPQSPYGARLLRAALFAAGAFEAAGATPVAELVLKDSKGTAEGAERAARALVADPSVVAIVGPVVPAAATAAARVAQDSGVAIVTLSPAAGITEIGAYVFRQYLMPEAQAEALAERATGALGLRRFAVLYPRDPYGESFMQPFWYALADRGGEVVSAVGYDISQTDFAEQIAALMGPFEEGFRGERYSKRGLGDFRIFAPFDAIYIPDDASRVGMIAAQLAYHEVRGVRLLGTNGWNDAEIFKAAGDQLEGAEFVDGFFAGDGSPAVRAFVEGFRARYGFDAGSAEAEAYDAVRMAMWAAAAAPRDREGVRAALASIGGYPGVAGTVSFRGQGEGRRTLHVLRVRGRSIVEAGATDGSDRAEPAGADERGAAGENGWIAPAPDDGWSTEP